MENQQQDNNTSGRGILVDRMQLVAEELPAEMWKEDNEGLMWEFLEEPDPNKFSPKLKALVEKYMDVQL